MTKPWPIPKLAAGQFKFPGLLFLAPEALLLTALAVNQSPRAPQFWDCLRNLRNTPTAPCSASQGTGERRQERTCSCCPQLWDFRSTFYSFQPPAAAAESNPRSAASAPRPRFVTGPHETPHCLSSASPSQVASRCRTLRSTSSSLEVSFSYDPPTFKCPHFKVPSTLLPSLSPTDCDWVLQPPPPYFETSFYLFRYLVNSIPCSLSKSLIRKLSVVCLLIQK